MARTRRAHGYEVHEAKDGEEALEFIARQFGGVDLVVADVVMPKMGGKVLLDILAQRFPAVPILLVSGYPGPGATGPDGRRKGRYFHRKPLDPEHLARKVREMLDAEVLKSGSS